MNMFRLVSLYSAVLLEYIFVVFGEENYEFSSPQTTVKAQENNTVLLPCYLNTLSTGIYYDPQLPNNLQKLRLK